MWGGQYSKYSVLILHIYDSSVYKFQKVYLLDIWFNRSKHGPIRLEQLLRFTYKEFWSKKNTKASLYYTWATGKFS